MRCIGDQIALRLDGLLERIERLVEACREPPQLAGPCLLQMARMLQLAGHILGATQEALDWRQGRARDGQAEQAGEQHPTRDQQSVGEQQSVEDRIDPGEREGHLHRPVVVRVPDREHFEMHAVHRGGAENAAVRARGDLNYTRVYRQRSCLAGRLERRPVWVDDLDVARRAAKRRWVGSTYPAVAGMGVVPTATARGRVAWPLEVASVRL